MEDNSVFPLKKKKKCCGGWGEEGRHTNKGVQHHGGNHSAKLSGGIEQQQKKKRGNSTEESKRAEFPCEHDALSYITFITCSIRVWLQLFLMPSLLSFSRARRPRQRYKKQWILKPNDLMRFYHFHLGAIFDWHFLTCRRNPTRKWIPSSPQRFLSISLFLFYVTSIRNRTAKKKKNKTRNDR